MYDGKSNTKDYVIPKQLEKLWQKDYVMQKELERLYSKNTNERNCLQFRPNVVLALQSVFFSGEPHC